MYVKINIINPRDISFSETFPSSQNAIILRIEDNQVYTYSNGEWIVVYQSKSIISTFFRISELMMQAMAMHAENLQQEHIGESPAYSRNAYDQIVEQMQILIAANP